MSSGNRAVTPRYYNERLCCDSVTLERRVKARSSLEWRISREDLDA